MTATKEAEIVDHESAMGELETASVTVVEAMVRGEIDIQVATAKQYPRSLERFYQRAIAMATYDEETAESCLYRRPVGKKKNDATGKWEEEYAEGMSIRMAEIVGACYGNMRVYATLLEQTERSVRTRGMAIDLETNFASSSEVVESTVKANGTPFTPRMRIVVAKATLSKARRDATFQVVPRALARPIETAVRKVLLGDAQTLEKRRQIVIAWIGKIGIAPARVYAALGIEGPADLSAEKLVVLTGIRTAIKENDITIDDAFPVTEDGNPPQPAQRKSQQTAAPEASGPAAPAPGPATSPGPSVAERTAAPAQGPAYVGVIVDVVEKPTGAIVKLDTGFKAATRNPSFIDGAKLLKGSGQRVELKTRASSDSTKYAPTLEEIIVLPAVVP